MLKQANDPISRLYALADMIEHGWNGLEFWMFRYGEVTDCGTSACIAGHACAAWQPKIWARFLEADARRFEVSEYGCASEAVHDAAANLLGLDNSKACDLFLDFSLTRKTAAAALRTEAEMQETGE